MGISEVHIVIVEETGAAGLVEGNVLGLLCAVVSPKFDDSRPSQWTVRVAPKQTYKRAKLLELMI